MTKQNQEVGVKGIFLYQTLMEAYVKEDLLDIARCLQLRKNSGLRKAELAQKISGELQNAGVMKRRTAVWSPQERALFERAMRLPFIPTDEEMEATFCLECSEYAYIDDEGYLCVPEDVAVHYLDLNTPEYREYSRKMSWLAQCLNFGEKLYGIFDKDVLRELFNQKKGMHISEEELEKLCFEFPVDLTGLHIEENYRYLVNESLVNGSDDYKTLLEIQKGKTFYLPTPDEVEDFYQKGYLSQTPAYRTFTRFLKEKTNMTTWTSERLAGAFWRMIQDGSDLEDLLRAVEGILAENGLEPDEQDEIEIVQCVQDLNNQTRLLINRGNTPLEVLEQEREQGLYQKPLTVTAGSTEAANLLREAAGELASMGVHVDLESNAAEIPKAGETDKVQKIYPNDPCPCGSGKKYKKCCGRNA